MNPCQRIESKQIAGEALDAEEGAHVSACGRCRARASALTDLEGAGRVLAAFGQVEASEVAGLRARLGAPAPRRASRLVLAAAALAACLVISLAFFRPPPTAPEDVSMDLMTLFDEVETITDGSQWTLAPVMGLDYGWQEEAVVAEDDLPLPAGFQVIDEAL